jgi:hypothetical protein
MQTFALRAVRFAITFIGFSLVLAAVVLPIQAFGADAPIPPPEPSTWGLVWQGLIGLAGTVLTVVMAIIGSAIRAKAKDSKFGAIVSQLWVMVQAAVAHAEADLRPKLQKALEDGSLSPEEGVELKKAVIDELKIIGAEQLQGLVKSFGLPEGAINTMLSGLVERAVSLLKVTPVPSPLATTSPGEAPAPVAPASPQ